MTVRLDPAHHAWLRNPAARAVIDALSPGGEDAARFVGGCVRNALMNRPVADIDIATRLDPKAAAARLEAAGIKVIPTGIEHGTLTAVVYGAPFEVTSLRKDVETFGRRAVVAFTTDWREDALRRDFRLNAIYCRLDGTLYDPFGGVADALAGRIIFIGEARDRIAEDHLRILRFYRFNAWYGSGIDAEGQAACAAMADTLKALSAERIWKELKKLLAAPDPTAALEAMQEGHVLAALIPGALDFRLLLSLINSDRGKSRAPDPLLRAAALAGRDEAAMMALCEQMKASNAEKARAHALCAPLSAFELERLDSASDEAGLTLGLYRLDPDAVTGRLRLDEAAGLGEADRALDMLAGLERPVFPVKGRDLIAAGLKRGPQLGVWLDQLEKAWIQSGFTLTREALIARAAQGAS